MATIDTLTNSCPNNGGGHEPVEIDIDSTKYEVKPQISHRCMIDVNTHRVTYDIRVCKHCSALYVDNQVGDVEDVSNLTDTGV